MRVTADQHRPRSPWSTTTAEYSAPSEGAIPGHPGGFGVPVVGGDLGSGRLLGWKEFAVPVGRGVDHDHRVFPVGGVERTELQILRHDVGCTSRARRTGVKIEENARALQSTTDVSDVLPLWVPEIATVGAVGPAALRCRCC